MATSNMSNNTKMEPSNGLAEAFADINIQSDNMQNQITTRETMFCANRIVIKYLLDNVPEFQELAELRERGWKSPEGDRYFQKQRQNADNASEKVAQGFFVMMKQIGTEMQKATGALIIQPDFSRPPKILDMCMAPGGFLTRVLDLNPGSEALAFTLPLSKGGHKARLAQSLKVETKYLDITMLAEDMGVTDISILHPDFHNFRPKQFADADIFDIVLCDGQVLRTHQKASYRESREARRLTLSQLVMGLEHLQPGGTMIVLLHKVEAWDTVKTLYTFNKFSFVRLFKPSTAHKTRSSFYMIATGVQSQSIPARVAIRQWKRIWEAATFELEDSLYEQCIQSEDLDVAEVLGEFGEDVIRLGKDIWMAQARALKKAVFVKRGM